RLFNSERIIKLMDRMGLEEGEVISHSMVSKSIERAQKKVEENNFGIRKRLLEYDDIMNSQREVIYSKRRNALYGERLGVEISNMIYDISESIVEEYQGYRDYEGFKLELFRLLSIECPFSEKEFFEGNITTLTEDLHEKGVNHYIRKSEFIAKTAMPVIQDVYDNQGAQYENIVVPITDGIKTINITTPLEKTVKSEGKELVKTVEKAVILAMIDDDWKEHLREMDELKQSVQNAVHEQKDPLLIYKFEAFKLFNEVLLKMNKEVGSFLMKCNLPQQEGNIAMQEQAPRKPDMSQLEMSRPETAAPTQQGEQAIAEPPKPKTQPVRVEKKVGRNEACPCGSGKKFKQCHGKLS
ncbi:MAG: SEC-C domain-containing protein, partial [Flavobacteriales bacterium]|nr:SEC-C domain-containing protein [Flavobacteriales bacterium]